MIISIMISGVLITVLICFIVFGVKHWKRIKSRFGDTDFKVGIWITGVIMVFIMFLFTYFLAVLFLDPLFVPKINLDYECEYHSYFGEFDFGIENKGKVGEEGFSLTINNIILKNFTVNPIGNKKVIEFKTEENIPAYSIDKKWANDYCKVSTSSPILESDPRPRKRFPPPKGEYIKLECKYIPPKSEFKLHFYSLGDNQNIDYEFWGKNTQPKRKVQTCSKATCYGMIKDLLIDIYYKLTGKWEIRWCSEGNYSRSFG